MSLHTTQIILLGEEASPSIGNTLWRVWTTFTRSAITPPEAERIWMKFGALRLYCLEQALADFGRDPRRSESGSANRFFVFFCQVNNARLYRLSVGQISRHLHTRRVSASTWIVLQNVCENLPVRGLFSKNLNKHVIIVNDFRLQSAISP